MLQATRLSDQAETTILKVDTPVEVSFTMHDVKRAVERLKNHTAAGLDTIPAGLIKQLGIMGYGYLRRVFNKMLLGQENIPSEWSEGRVPLLEKAN